MAFMDIKPNENDFAIVKGMRWFVSESDLVVNFTSGQYRYNQTYFKNAGSSITVSAAAAGKLRLDIVYVSNVADSEPQIEEGSEVVADPEYPSTPADSTGHGGRRYGRGDAIDH